MKCNPWVGGSIGRRGFPMLGTGKRGLSTYVKELFKNGEQGFFYDPNDLSTMFQDAAGTIPVTDVGQPVGRILDKSGRNNHTSQNSSSARPLLQQNPILGGEIITNGDFSNGLNGWVDVLAETNGAWWGNVAGRAYHPLTSAFRELNQTFSAINAVVVSFDYEVLSTNGSAQWIYINGANAVKTRALPSGSGRVAFTVTDGIRLIAFGRIHGKSAEFYIDNVSIKGITSYRTDKNHIKYDAVDDKLITNIPSQLTGCTVIRSVPNVGTQILTGQTIPATYEDSTDHCGLIVINRALTPSETSAITAEFNKRAGV